MIKKQLLEKVGLVVVATLKIKDATDFSLLSKIFVMVNDKQPLLKYEISNY